MSASLVPGLESGCPCGRPFLRFTTREWPEAERFLEEIGARTRHDRLCVFGAPAEAWADVIGQFFQC